MGETTQAMAGDWERQAGVWGNSSVQGFLNMFIVCIFRISEKGLGYCAWRLGE